MAIAIASGAVAVTLTALTAHVPHATARWTVVLAFLALFVVLGELLPIGVRRGDGLEMFTFSGLAAMALIDVGALWIVVVAQLSAALIDDLRRSRPPRKLCFNVSQYSITLVLTWLVYSSLSHQHLIGHGAPHFSVTDLGPALVAGFAYFLINATMVSCVLALAERKPIFSLLPVTVWRDAPMGAMLPITAPVVLAALEFSPWIAPLCLVPALSVRAGAQSAAKRELQALHDVLTGLPNRALLFDQAKAGFHSATESAMAAMILIDLDRFKEVNDTMGHFVGDEVLRQVAGKLSDAVRPGDTFARLGGDEFAVFCRGLRDAAAALAIADRIVDALTGVIDLEGVNLNVEASAGVALSPLHAKDVDLLLQRADIALYRAKGEKRGSVMLYDESFDDTSIEQLTLMGQLRRGLEDELVVYYQPKCRLSDGAVVGVEALVRWEHPKLGLLPPARFVSSAEKSGLILPLTVQVLHQVLDQWLTWREEGLDLSIAVNVSAVSICDPMLPVEVRRMFDELPTPKPRVLIEITETSMVRDIESANVVLDELRSIGLNISIDDFGTGHSSLAHIKELGPVEVKIDRSFVVASTESDRDVALIRAATELGHGLGMVVVAEGVETREQLNLVAEVGCDLAQGFFILPPVSGDELAAWAMRPQVWFRRIAAVQAVVDSDAAEP
ncbi:MAG: putative bifunctional diguanylate cyclase/phosphodiesterase [Acidimicrobiales bacterium]